jgi:hypothetical protein
MEKLNCPGMLSKYAADPGRTANVTGIVMAIVPVLEVTTIWPV